MTIGKIGVRYSVGLEAADSSTRVHTGGVVRAWWSMDIDDVLIIEDVYGRLHQE